MTGNISRRRVLEFLGSAAALYGTGKWEALAQTAGDFSEDDIARIILEEGDLYFTQIDRTQESEASLRAVLREEFERLVARRDWRWWEAPKRRAPVWPPAVDTADEHHLVDFSEPPTQFVLTPQHLELLAARNSFELARGLPRTIVGLRGCSLENEGEDSGWAETHHLQLTVPDHLNLRCLIGVWDRPSRQMRLFKASTVPEVSSMSAHLFEVSGCNQLPTGLYQHQIGTHRANSRYPQPGAFRQAQAFVVLRSPNDLSYNISDTFEVWDQGWPYDNIHASVFYGRTESPRFSSAGCQVVAGNYRTVSGRWTPAGPWARFREAAGLSNTAPSSQNGRSYDYMLLSGTEAALAAQMSEDFERRYHRVRFGSRGSAAAAVQRSIGTRADGVFLSASVVRLLLHQRDQLGAPMTGIWSI